MFTKYLCRHPSTYRVCTLGYFVIAAATTGCAPSRFWTLAAVTLTVSRSPNVSTIGGACALCAACQGELALYKRLKHGTLVMRFSFLPAWDKAVATAQELKMIRGNFEDRFPAHGRFL